METLSMDLATILELGDEQRTELRKKHRQVPPEEYLKYKPTQKREETLAMAALLSLDEDVPKDQQIHVANSVASHGPRLLSNQSNLRVLLTLGYAPALHYALCFFHKKSVGWTPELVVVAISRGVKLRRHLPSSPDDRDGDEESNSINLWDFGTRPSQTPESFEQTKKTIHEGHISKFPWETGQKIWQKWSAYKTYETFVLALGREYGEDTVPIKCLKLDENTLFSWKGKMADYLMGRPPPTKAEVARLQRGFNNLKALGEPLKAANDEAATET